MKRIVASILAILGLGVSLGASEVTPSQMSDELRSMALTLTPEEVEIDRESYPYPVYALVMDTGYPEGSVTLSSVVGGAASLYFSNGGGIIGGGEHESVRAASSNLLSRAQRFYEKGSKVTKYPKPKAGMVIFYFISLDGVFSYAALEDDLGNERDDLSSLFFCAHDVITELRQIEGAE